MKTTLTFTTVFFAFILVAVNAATTSSITILPYSPGVVCAQTVCPTATQVLDKRATPACPATCPDNCSFIDDVCCPGVQKAVCNSSASVTGTIVSTGIATATATFTNTASASASASVSVSVSASASASSAVVSSTSATTTTPTSTSNGNTIKYTLSTSMLSMFFVTIFYFSQ